MKEILRGELIKCEEIHKKGDVFSYGVTMFEVLTRSRAWQKATTRKTNTKESSNSLEDFMFEILLKGVRPEFPANLLKLSQEDVAISKTIDIIQRSWKQDADARPTFADIINQVILSSSAEC